MSSLLANVGLQKHGLSNALVVVLHGWRGSARAMAPLLEVVRETHRDADILCPEYRAGWGANTDPAAVAHEIQLLISDVLSPGHERVVLLGHSAGGLLLRKALLLGRVASQLWAERVERIVLLAGLNRGWSLDERPAQMRAGRYRLYRWATAVAAMLGRGQFIRGLRRGEPFIANLRLGWMRLERASNHAMPLVVQVVGTRDDVVSARDSIDVQSGRQFCYLEVGDTGHLDIIRLDDPQAGQRRRRVIHDALDKSITDLRALSSTLLEPIGTDISVSDFVLIRHGIRDYGHWMRHLAERVRAIAVELNLTVESETSGYGYFPMGPFLIWGRRQAKVRRFVDEYVGAVAKYPNARIHFIGHSNGTHLLAGALRDCESVRFEHVVLAGSVMPTHYPWNDIGDVQKRVAAVRNYVGSADWVVAIFPHFFEFIRELLRLRWRVLDIGSAGFNDFQDDFGRRHSVQFSRGGHSAALARVSLDSVARFTLEGEADVPASVRTETQSAVVQWVGRLCWLVWIVIAGAIIGGAWFAAVTYGGWVLLAYVVVVYLLLNSI